MQLRRRSFVSLGALAGLGLPWHPDPQGLASETVKPAAAKACILIWLDGGPSHLDMFDPKPDASVEVRGPFASIATSVPGVRFSELMPLTAQWMHRLALIRSMTSPLGEHNLATHYLLSGYKPTTALAYPSMGALVDHLCPTDEVLPNHIAVPHHRVGGGLFLPQGYLSAAHAPFEIGSDPASPSFQVKSLQAPVPLSDSRLRARRSSLEFFERKGGGNGTSAASPREGTAERTDAIQQAFELTLSKQAREAFEIEKEPTELRQRYGYRGIGQCCLLARRLVERGVKFVTVNHLGWDTHQDLTTNLKLGFAGARDPVGLVPSLDIAFSTLLMDLDQRGILNETLVVMMGEFGRTPKINVQGGRDHWPRVFSVVLAGGGVAGGQVIGASDSTGESVTDRPTAPAELAASVLKQMGIDPHHRLMTRDGRPVSVADAAPLRELCG